MNRETFFEDSLKEKVADLRLIPSHEVWDTIVTSLHGSKRSGREVLLMLFATIVLSASWLHICEFSGSKKYLTDFNSISQKKYKSPLKSAVQNAITSRSQFISYKKEHSIAQRHFSNNIPSSLSTIEHLKEPHSNQDPLHFSERTGVPVNNSISHIPVYALNQSHAKQKELFKKRKLNFLNIYITPSVSYRFLYNKKMVPEFRDADPEKMVSHHASSGIEAGVAIIKPFSKRWNFKTGVQLNFSRYEIRAMQGFNELIYVSTNPNAALEQNANNSSLTGLEPKKLMNEHFQISLPIGLEYKVAGNNKISFHLAATIQPSYTIQASGYMATSNYKNYIQADHLFRRYNVQSALESYVKINAGIMSLQAGPQIRYQLLSNTTDSHPIGEHLVDYGFKFGIFTPLK